jgi:hypothetical protein
MKAPVRALTFFNYLNLFPSFYSGLLTLCKFHPLLLNVGNPGAKDLSEASVKLK